MKFINKTASIALATTLGISSISTSIYAIETDVINELWGKPTVVYGGGLSDEQIAQTQNLFGITNTENVYQLTVDSNDVATYLNFYGSDTSSLISSVMVQKTDSNGVVVNILTPENITQITEQQYINAAITAGVYNCEIDVASIMTVTGESALTGVYKAFEANGETLDSSRTAVAQEELEVTNEIANENEGTEGFDTNTLDEVMVEIKQDMAELKNTNGEITYEDIVNIVNEIISKYNLQDILTQENIDRIIQFAQNYANTSAIDSEEVLEQLNSFASSLSGQLGDLYQQAKESGLWDKFLNWVKGIISSVTGN